jgi:uncharacterized membrane protein YfcA
MITYVTVTLAALAGAFLSFFCGFGLGTLLLPAFMLFFPAQVAIAATAVVHMANNVFKLFLVGKYAHRGTLLSFGITSVFGALLGAWSLQGLAKWGDVFSYTLAGRAFHTDTIRIVIALVILGFALLELSPALNRLSVPSRWLPVGGFLSGFFGGLSGHQGALRSAFLMRAGLTKDAFMGTRVVCACLVDVSRISVYAASIAQGWEQIRLDVLAIATLAAFGGAWQGNKLVKKTELPMLNKIITLALVLFAIGLGGGFL